MMVAAELFIHKLRSLYTLELRGTRLSYRCDRDLELAAGIRCIPTCSFLVKVSLIQDILQ